MQEIGEEKYQKFATEKIESESLIWGTIKKRYQHLLTTTTNVKVNGEILQIRGKRKLMDRILVASRSQSQIDLPKIFRTYEFSFVHLSIFARGGKDRSVIDTQLRESQPDDTAIEEGEEKNSRKVLIIDAMAIVNKVDIRAESIEIDFASNFS